MEMIEKERLLQIIEAELASFPNLKSVLPGDYPRASHYEINPQKMAWYGKNRDSKNWHHYNLPLALYNSWSSGRNGANSDLHSLTRSILVTFDDFATEFSKFSGFSSTIRPLFKSAWDLIDPKMWSVLGECSLALFLHRKGIHIYGFGMKIGNGSPNADIRIDLNGKIAHIDVEMQHLGKNITGSRWHFRKLLKHRGLQKIDKKYKYIPEGEVGAIASIFLVKGKNYKRFSRQNLWTTRPVYRSFFERNPFAQIYWIVGARMNAGELKFHIIDRSTKTEEPQDFTEIILGRLYDSKVFRYFDQMLLRVGLKVKKWRLKR